MSLFEDIADQNKNPFQDSRPKQTGGDTEPEIMQSAELVGIARQVVEANQATPRARKNWKNNRFRLKSARWQLGNVLGNVNQSIFANMVGSSLEGMEKTISHAQGNGKWVVTEYELDIRRDSNNDECVMLAVKWVDSLDQPDLQYHNGAPAMNINIKNTGLSDDAIKALTEKSASSDDAELKGLLKQLIGAMAQKEGVQPAVVADVQE